MRVTRWKFAKHLLLKNDPLFELVQVVVNTRLGKQLDNI